MLEFEIKQTELFEKIVKKLSKKYNKIEEDIDFFIDNINTISDLGVHLGKNLSLNPQVFS